MDQLGTQSLSSVGDGGGRRRELQRRGQHETLTDPGNQRLPGIPSLAVGAPLPLARGDQSASFAPQTNAGRLAEAEIRQIFVHAVDAQGMGEHVEIDIAGLLDRFFDPDDPMPARPPIAISTIGAGQGEPSTTPCLGSGVLEPSIEARKPQKRLDRRTRGDIGR